MIGSVLRLVVLIVAASSIVGCSFRGQGGDRGAVLSRTSQDLGFGYRLVRESREVAVSFESVGHWSYLYHKDRELGTTVDYAISPDGKYAIFQDSPTGAIMLFKAETGDLSVVVSEYLPFEGLQDGFRWDPESNTFVVTFNKGSTITVKPE